MQILIGMVAVFAGYLIGSIPFGMLIVKSKTGKDIRRVESGRTGGTNAVRAAGFWAGLLTAILDIAKGAASVWLAETLTPNDWIHILAPLAAIIGHNYSIFLITREEGKIRFHGGAGGAPALGGAIGLWPGIFPYVVVGGALVWATTGIASLTTISIGLIIITVFGINIANGIRPPDPQDIWYGIFAELLLLWALRPNLKKLFTGQERVVKYSLNGWLKARKAARAEAKNAPSDSKLH